MKGLAVFLFFCLALASAAFIERPKTPVVADETFVRRQREIIQLFYHVYQPNAYKEQVTLGREYNIEANIGKYDDASVVRQFLFAYKHHMLPKGQTFSVTYTQQRNETLYLFELFYHAKDYDTFYQTACWAREFINEEMFVYAYSAALLHRDDCRGFFVPPLYNIFPQYFFTTETIERAYKVKMQGSGKFLGDFVYEGQNNEVFVYSNYSNWYYNYNWEQRLNYFTEDISLNQYYYNAHLEFPYWMDGHKYGLYGENRGDVFYFMHQQILARYYLERLSNGMGEIPEFSWDHPYSVGYDPYLSYSNGIRFPSRPCDFEFDQYFPYLTQVQNYERRIRDAIDRGFFEKYDGTRVSLRTPESIEVLADVLESNADSVNFEFYGYPQFLARSLVGNSPFPESWHQIYPAALELYQTSLRDPAFYSLFKHYFSFFKQYQNFLTPYTQQELSCPGVKIENVHVAPLVTYFENVDTEISNAVFGDFSETMTKDSFNVRAVQNRLAHRPFTVTTNLFSEKQTKVVFRYFIGPKFNGQNDYITLDRNRENFFQLDQFVYELNSGKNTVERNSADFYFTEDDSFETRTVMQNIRLFAEEKKPFPVQTNRRFFSFPQRLALPKGVKGGLPLYFYVIVTPYQAPAVTEGVDYPVIDQFNYGYPFDRPLYVENFQLSNMFFEDVVVYHKTEAEINRPQN